MKLHLQEGRKVMLVKCKVFINITTKNIFKLCRRLLIKLIGMLSWDLIHFSDDLLETVLFDGIFPNSELSLQKRIKQLLFSLRSWKLSIWQNLLKLLMRWNWLLFTSEFWMMSIIWMNSYLNAFSCWEQSASSKNFLMLMAAILCE